MAAAVASDGRSVALLCALSGAAGVVAAVTCSRRNRCTRREGESSASVVEVWELGGKYYQVLGHAWDHEVSLRMGDCVGACTDQCTDLALVRCR